MEVYAAYMRDQVLELLAERAAQVFGPLLATEVRRRRRVGQRWFVDEGFLFRKGEKRYLYRAVDEDGVVAGVLLRDYRDTASAEAFFRQAIERSGSIPDEVVTDHHQPYVKVACSRACPFWRAKIFQNRRSGWTVRPAVPPRLWCWCARTGR